MKKIALVILVCIATLGLSPARAGVGLGLIKLKTGVKGGLSFYPADLTSNLPSSQFSGKLTYNTGFHVGVASRLELLKILYIEPEILYNHASYDIGLQPVAPSTSSGTTRVSDNFFSVPILGGLKLGLPFLPISMRVYVGPVFNIYSFGSYSKSYFSDMQTTHQGVGYQAGIGVSVLFIDVDLRISGTSAHPQQTFLLKSDGSRHEVDMARHNIMLTAGFMF